MSLLARCNGTNCDRKDECYRHLLLVLRPAYIVTHIMPEPATCDYFVQATEREIDRAKERQCKS